MDNSLRHKWHTLFNTRSLMAIFAVALMFTLATTYAQWQQLRAQELYRSHITQEPQVLHALTEVQRELLRFYGIIATTVVTEEQDLIIRHQNLVKGRFTVLFRQLDRENVSNATLLNAESIQAEWISLQSVISEWLVAGDETLLEEMKVEMTQIEKAINSMVVEEERLSYKIAEVDAEAFVEGIRRNRDSTLVAMLGFMLFLSLFSMGVIVALRRSTLSQKALHARERQLWATLETIPDAVARITREGAITSSHPGQITPLPNWLKNRGTHVGSHINEIVSSKIAEKILNVIDLALSENVLQQFELSMPLSEHDDGEPAIYEVRIIPISDNEVQGMVRDVTVERQKEKALLQSQKLESLGLLAGGVAHDFNNILTGIMGQAALAQARQERGKSSEKNIDKIIVASQRAGDLTRKLLSFAGKGQFLLELFDVNELVEDDRVFLETVSRKWSELQFEIAEHKILIEADKGQIQQILLNLVVNAGDAMGADGGQIIIRTGIETVNAADKQELWPKDRPFTSGNYGFFEVEDNGSGMSPEVMSKIFDPFFTTKSTGHGLGLSGTLGTVHRHGGGVRVSSLPGIGSRFTILFPLSGEIAVEAAQNAAARSFTLHAAGKILVVDDDHEVREFLSTVLTEAGADVLVAADGREAITLFTEHELLKPDIALIILDMMMPEMNGDEVYEKIRQVNPTVPVLVSSGYGNTVALDALIAEPNVTFLPKPYHANELLLKIQWLTASNTISVQAG